MQFQRKLSFSGLEREMSKVNLNVWQTNGERLSAERAKITFSLITPKKSVSEAFGRKV